MTPDAARNSLYERFAERGPYGVLLVDWSAPIGLMRNVFVADEQGVEPDLPLWARVRVIYARRERFGFPGRSARVTGEFETRKLGAAGEGEYQLDLASNAVIEGITTGPGDPVTIVSSAVSEVGQRQTDTWNIHVVVTEFFYDS